MLVERKKCIYVVIILSLLAVVFYGIKFKPEDKIFFRYCGYIILILDLWLAVRNRKNVILFFVYIVMTYFNFSFLYDLYMLNKPFLQGFYNMFSDDVILGKGVYMVLLFTVILFIIDFLVKAKEVHISSDCILKEKNKNMVLAWILLLIALISPQIWWQLFEYSGAIIILAILYGGKNKVFKIVCTLYIVCTFYLLNVMGMRVPGLCFPIIGLFMLYLDKLNYKNVSVGFVIGIILMTYSGLYTDTRGSATVEDAIVKLTESGGALDTCQFSYMSSQIGIKVADDILTESEKKDYFVRFLKSQIAISSSNVENAKMCKLTRQYYPHFDGQFIPHTFYFYLGWFGVLLSGAFVSIYLAIIKILNIKSSNLTIITSIWAVSMITKWYLYEPNALIKGYLFLLILFAICEFINTVVNKRRNQVFNLKREEYDYCGS